VTDHFRIEELVRRVASDRHEFAEFFRSPSGSLSLTVARWPARSVDDQRPHTEDEVYFVSAGRAVLTIGEERVAIGPGSLAFVPAGVEHRFSEITEDLETIVFWSPARRSNTAR
jgi:mannose-6-phosphate isomerase-like protein (cupin superfamily)